MDTSGPVLLFDGVCNVCNGAVQFIIAHDRRAQFRFASLQSDAGKALLREHGLGELPVSTMVLIDRGRVYLRSDGILRSAQRLGGVFALFVPLLLIPRVLRDAAYRMFARNRYRWFGKTDQCLVPTPEIRARFL
ncbi:MAG TPA: thiol-disulfide oxidoreductase DCC family protein [Polyangiales bacterium]|jgi:predicted DCC family thiol-disulfide oxidoreductase YuxK